MGTVRCVPSFSLILLLATLALGGFDAAAALTEAEIREKVSAQIALRHPDDTPEFWRGLGPAAPRVMREMLAESKSIHEKIRLLEGLGWFDSEEAKGAIRSATESGANRSLLRAGLRSALRTTGESAADEVAFVEGFLARSDERLRAQIAEILLESGTPEAMRAVERQLEREKTPWVAERMRRMQREMQDEARLRIERSQADGTQAFIAGKKRGVVIRSADSGLDPRFEGRWVGRWIGLPEVGGIEGVLTRALSIDVRIEKDAAAKAARGGVLRIEALPPTPPSLASSAAPVPFLLKGAGEEARGELEALEWKSLTSGLARATGTEGKLTLLARLLIGAGDGGLGLSFESLDGRQHWVFVRVLPAETSRRR